MTIDEKAASKTTVVSKCGVESNHEKTVLRRSIRSVRTAPTALAVW